MKILIVTELVDKNHEMFGFFHGRILDFAKECEQITLICLELREHSLPQNVKILSLGKESKRSRVAYTWKLLKYIWIERKNYDSVFVHLTPHYVVLGGWLWRLLGKDVVLWYSHRFVDSWLKVAEKFANCVLTTPENANIKNNKWKIFDRKTDLEAYSSYLNEKGFSKKLP